MRVRSSRAWQLGAVAASCALAAVVLPAAALPKLGAPAEAATPTAVVQDYGPYTCLSGFVWREAVPNDVVCVTPDVRALTRQDNALASRRRSPNGGPYGPDTCLQGYVWREAVATDRVCVTPATREQARSDNLSAASRRNELRTAVGTYGTTRRFYVRTDRINVVTSRVVLYSSATGKVLRWWRVSVSPHASAPGGWLSFRTGVAQCSGAFNSYFRVIDGSSTRKSPRRYVCSVL